MDSTKAEHLLAETAHSHSHSESESEESSAGVSPFILNALETLDNIAHVIVAAFFIVLAGSALVYSGMLLIRDIPLMAQPASPTVEEHTAEVAHGASPFLHGSLELLSTLLFAVIVLELLKTIITYLKTHNIQAIMKEFLVVGIISSIRKILLVGAESSLASDPGASYIQEATGTVLTIVGILLMIAGLIFLQKSGERERDRSAKGSGE